MSVERVMEGGLAAEAPDVRSTVLLVDDHQLVRDGLRLVIDGADDL